MIWALRALLLAVGVSLLLGACHSPEPPAAEPRPLASAQPEPAQGYGARGASQAQPQVQRGGWFRIDEVARAIDPRTAADVWHRFRTGEPGVLGRHIYTPDGQSTFDEIAYRYTSESDFRISVDRYINDFERLLGEAEQSDPSGRVVHNYLTSDQGRVYLLLAHASGRLQ